MVAIFPRLLNASKYIRKAVYAVQLPRSVNGATDLLSRYLKTFIEDEEKAVTFVGEEKDEVTAVGEERAKEVTAVGEDEVIAIDDKKAKEVLFTSIESANKVSEEGYPCGCTKSVKVKNMNK
ncbi:hypothetical protein QJS10_CPA06g01790 [Acorus calamus]|uniref:Uncharacterized protein n=1 Tax=Acorus calamus TaxID=4465 RepID=A0AAV9EK78_ACOCL|nr:hypothetical protein QJS10_CPA06g01790 [Acorus calamus]